MKDPNTDNERLLPERAVRHDLVPANGAAQAIAASMDVRGGYGADSGGDEDSIDFASYWRTLLKRRWTVLTAFGIVVAIALVGTLLQTPIFRASAVVQIERESIKVLNVGDVTPTSQTYDLQNDFYNTQYALLKSRALANRVAEQPGLASDPAIQRMLEPPPVAKLMEFIAGMFKPAQPAAKARLKAEPVSHETLVGLLMGNTAIEPIRASRLVKIHFMSPDPRFSSRVANEFADAYIAMNLERRLDASSYAKTFLEDGLQKLQIKLQDSERRLVEFAQKEGIINVQDKESLLSEQLQQINTALGEAEGERIKAESHYKQLNLGSGESLPEVLQSDLIGKLKGDLASLQTEYQNKLGLFKPEYPAMQQMASQINELKRQIHSEITNIKGGITGDYEAARSKESLLRQRLESLKTAVLDLQQRSIQYTILKREVDTTRQLYDGLLQRYKEVGVAGGVGTNNISVVDQAEIPKGRFSPSLSKNLAFASIFGLILGGLLAFLLERLDDTVKSPEDAEQLLGMAVLGVIPTLRKDNPFVELKEERSAFAESYRSARTALQFSTDVGVPRTLCITSSSPNEGKTTTAVALAYQFAQLKKRVLLIDADMRNPSLHKVLNLRNGEGLSNCLVGSMPPLNAICLTEIPNVLCIPSGPVPPNPTELLAGSRMVELLTLAQKRFDLVIIDSPPVLGIADAPVLGNIAAGTLLVVQCGGTRISYARNVIKRLFMARTRLLGVLLTKFNVRQAGYYGAGYYYGGNDTVYGVMPEKALKKA